MEASIPISILAIGLARVYKRRSTLLENVILTGIGGTSGAVVAGAIFTLPALYILQLDPHPLQTIFICLAGGCLGVLFLIPLRRYFVREMHGQLPYPRGHGDHRGAGHRREGRVAGQAAAAGHGDRRRLRLLRDDLPGVEGVRRPAVRAGGETLAEQGARWSSSFDAVAFILGLGYVMGLRSSMILCAGGVLSNFVLVPLIWMIGQPPHRRARLPGDDPDRADDRRADLPRLRAVHRRRRHRDRRHLRHHQVAARSSPARSRSRQGVPARRGRDAPSAPTATSRRGDADRRRRRRARRRASSSAALGVADGHPASAWC